MTNKIASCTCFSPVTNSMNVKIRDMIATMMKAVVGSSIWVHHFALLSNRLFRDLACPFYKRFKPEVMRGLTKLNDTYTSK